MNRRYLFAAVIWCVPGVIITIKGIRAYSTMEAGKLWWLFLITAFVLIGFFFMFRKIVNKYSARIGSQPEKTSFWQTFPLRGWILIAFMMCLGMALKFLNVPQEFTASFYSGLGPMLLLSAFRFLMNGKK